MFSLKEEKQIKINGQNHDYKLKRIKRMKCVRLTIQHDGSLVVTASRTYPVFLIKQFIISRWEWVISNVAKVKARPTLLSFKHSDKQIKEYKKQARKLVTTRLNYFNQIYNLKYNRVAIRNQSSRWGSCSSSNNLNFNYRLCLLPQELADYIIVHELCHLQEMNHSKNFWALVAKVSPDYRVKEKQLKNFG